MRITLANRKCCRHSSSYQYCPSTDGLIEFGRSLQNLRNVMRDDAWELRRVLLYASGPGRALSETQLVWSRTARFGGLRFAYFPQTPTLRRTLGCLRGSKGNWALTLAAFTLGLGFWERWDGRSSERKSLLPRKGQGDEPVQKTGQTYMPPYPLAVNEDSGHKRFSFLCAFSCHALRPERASLKKQSWSLSLLCCSALLAFPPWRLNVMHSLSGGTNCEKLVSPLRVRKHPLWRAAQLHVAAPLSSEVINGP